MAQRPHARGTPRRVSGDELPPPLRSCRRLPSQHGRVPRIRHKSPAGRPSCRDGCRSRHGRRAIGSPLPPYARMADNGAEAPPRRQRSARGRHRSESPHKGRSRRERNHSAASASSPSSTEANMVLATTPAWSRTLRSIDAAISLLSRRNCLAFSRPWPMRTLS